MPAIVTTAIRWNPANLDRAILSAFKPSLKVAQADAVAHSPAKSKAGAKVIGVSASTLATARGTLAPTGIGNIFEVGRQGGYPIVPGGVAGLRRTKGQSFTSSDQFGRNYSVRRKRGSSSKALRFTRGDGGHAAYAVGGAMRSDPYINPAGRRWAQGGFQRVAQAQLARRGFR